MAIAAIYVLISLAAFLSWLGFSNEDSWMVVFGGTIFIFSGLHTLINGFQDLNYTYAQVLGIILIFFGTYLTTRSTVEFIQENM